MCTYFWNFIFIFLQKTCFIRFLFKTISCILTPKKTNIFMDILICAIILYGQSQYGQKYSLYGSLFKKDQKCKLTVKRVSKNMILVNMYGQNKCISKIVAIFPIFWPGFGLMLSLVEVALNMLKDDWIVLCSFLVCFHFMVVKVFR